MESTTRTEGSSLEQEPDLIQTGRQIKQNQQTMCFQKWIIDVVTADSILVVYHGLKPENRSCLFSLSVPVIIKAVRRLTQ